ncbi:deoxyribose-phosphate aldolase [uncultured Eudoraea sp.]|uniref:deoxyribose-phosphate aldolase n=1 Tax=uncultured Eudoraea sp. TaxID=1035614 RepID=UPI0026067893|nr:deoxyribose-phosphate aldolase [uncultured Eudoraea sp.]
MQIERFIDHTLLKPTATPKAIRQLCTEAKDFKFYAVCVNSCYVPLVAEELKGTGIKIASVIGFPLGAMSSEAKLYEAEYAIKHGADEIDMVINLGLLKSGEYELVKEEISKIKHGIGPRVLKVIIETCYLTTEEKKTASKLVLEAKADYVKTSTGFGTGGATFKDIELIKNVVQNRIRIKASGGIKDLISAERYIDMGVSRLGTSSGIKLVQESKQ